MKIGSAYPSAWLKSSDLPDDGQMVRAVVDTLTIEEIGGEQKPVLYFQGKDRGLILNKTNAGIIQASYGDETNDWAGKPVLLYAAETTYQGKVVMGIRVKVPKTDQRGTSGNGGPAPEARRRPAPSQAKAPAEGDEGGPVYTDAEMNLVKEDDIPFGWEGRRQAML